MPDGNVAAAAREREPADDCSLVENAVWALDRSDPKASARRLFGRSGIQLGLGCGAGIVGALIFGGDAILVAVAAALTCFFLVSLTFRIGLVLAAATPPLQHAVATRRLRDDELPPVTILLPLFREAASLPGLACAIDKLDYPREKLDILLVLECEDEETIVAARALAFDERWRIVLVPPAAPQTKPKACNYALHFARGSLTVIYDAEDEPEPDQLRKAAERFSCADGRLACLQAKLNFYNADENWLTRLFTIEYSMWFDTFLPALHRLHLPIPLGGTSNIFRTRILREVGGWDPFNVTEDADLGLRLARLGYRVEVLDSTTFEEANCRLGNWLRQRSRWMKGYMQTYVVHRRSAHEMAFAAGKRSLLTLHLFVGGTVLAALINPWLIAASAFDLLAGAAGRASPLPHPLPALNMFALVFGNLVFVALAAIAPLKRGLKGLAPSALLAPLYWQITSIAAYKALWQLFRRPHFWEKTDHMISRNARNRAATPEVLQRTRMRAN
jgi:cellulose synthase/poly-beta-1,6-N-acetylglucosamine synthase-like glycosyltransferase